MDVTLNTILNLNFVILCTTLFMLYIVLENTLVIVRPLKKNYILRENIQKTKGFKHMIEFKTKLWLLSVAISLNIKYTVFQYSFP